ncbi:hypothetical protein GCM10009530_75560 [Microbispora corallina]|uniref:Glycosyltransferase n=1 Tax=Microbispora corallina TaxID=83302 RepID=A0ABQ4G736_9ACTN|nr:hypothetical protein [Microbispora corallina]GIH42813.1 hypothetical protein Mco01_58130 [Microbispora corallina]
MIRAGELAISVAAMAHPSRADAVRAMADAHADLGITVVFDPEPDRGHSLATALAAWSAVEPGATHHLVVQDDVIFCDGFARLLAAVVRARPDSAIGLFAEWGSRTASMIRVAALRGAAFAAVADPYVPTQALVLPAEHARALGRRAFREIEPDDIAVRRHLREARVTPVVAVPNLVEHDDRPSLTGNGFQGLRHSACHLPAPRFPVPAAEAAGTGLAHVPHLSWMRLVAEWFPCGPDDEPGWTGQPLAARLPAQVTMDELRGTFTACVRGADALRAALTEIVLFEFWLYGVGVGLVAGVPPDAVAARAKGPVCRAALLSAFPGAFRRCLPLPALRELGEDAFRLLCLAVRTGAEVALRR